MSIFAIGDTHLSFGTNKPMNIFKGWDNYVERLTQNWHALVTEKDTVVIAGDISWAMSLEEAKADFQFLQNLPGQKIILKGNHDYWWNTRRKMDAFLDENGLDTLKILHNNAYRVGDFAVCGTRGWFFDAQEAEAEKVLLREAQRLRTSNSEARKLGGEPIVFLHYPPLTSTQECTPILQVLQDENIHRCYYAHLHGGSAFSAFQGEKYGTKFALLSCDYLKFCPKLIELIKS